MKIIYSWGHSRTLKPFIEAEIKGWINAGYELTSINHREELDIERAWSSHNLNELYTNEDEALCKFYKKIANLAETHDVFIVNYENVYHPEFVNSLRDIYTVIISGDDPEGSDYCSKSYVHAFNHSFAWGISFDKDTRITERFLQWGARRADWWPHGVSLDMYNPSLTEEDIYNEDRDVDLVYVGASGIKLERLAKIKRTFPQMKIYGRGWTWKGILSRVVRGKKLGTLLDSLVGGLWKTEELPMNELIPLYQRAKIGVNVHLSYGPSNQRLYQLPANGVMQICDCPEGLGQIFKIGKEVVAYHSIEEAIELIRYYLEHDDERKKIAAAGFKRTMKDYQRLTTFSRAIAKIKKGMLEDGIRYFKDGTPIEYEG